MEPEVAYEPLSPDGLGGPLPTLYFSPLWRAINAIMTIFLAMAAFVQINDENPALWVALYSLPAILTATVTIKPEYTEHVVWQSTCVMDLLLSLVMALYKLAYVVDLISEGLHNPLIHMEGRELAGLCIVVIWMSLCRFTQVGKTHPGTRSLTPLLALVAILGLIPLVAWAICFVEQLATNVAHCKDMFPGLLGPAYSHELR